jgi:aminoacyl tRNA synthase complex-interacting multifunctional protein 1
MGFRIRVTTHQPTFWQAALATQERSSYPNLLRWIDYVQNKYDQSHVYEWIPVFKPKFDPPVSAEPNPKKVVSAVHDPSVKEKSSTGTAAIASGQQKPITKEENGRPYPLPDKKGVSQTDAKKVHQEKKEPTPAQKDDFGLEILDIKVGVIKTVKKHPTAETLYVEEIDVGEDNLRQVVSGLAKFLTEDEMLNRRVLVLANVKPSKLRDVLSSGLVLCTSNDDHSQCEPVIPPKEAKIGERVTAEGHEGKPEAVLNPKKKQWEKIYPHLHTDDAGVACYKGKPLTTSAGPCTSSIVKGTIK